MSGSVYFRYTSLRRKTGQQFSFFYCFFLKEKFNEIDADGSGEITRDELKASMAKDVSDADIDFLLNVRLTHTKL